jgi:hypothetical protein
MRKLWIRAADAARRFADATRRFICKCFGHKKVRGSVGTVGAQACLRCHRITDQLTNRRGMTRGELERAIDAKLTDGWSLERINWKKKVAHLVDRHGNRRAEALNV